MEDKFEFAIERLEEEANKAYIQDTLSRICGLKIDLRFIQLTDMKNMNFDQEDPVEDEKSPEEALLQDVLGDTLEIKDDKA